MNRSSQETEPSEASCSFCEKEFGPVAKLVPDCGRLICLKCYDWLVEDLAESRRFKCRACKEHHSLPESGYPNCKQLPRPFDKALPPQAKELQALIKNIQQELTKLEKFDAREHIERHCERLELEVGEAADWAVKYIDKTEKDLLSQIKKYRQRCLDALAADAELSPEIGELKRSISKTKSRLDALVKEIDEFSDKWTQHFRELSVYVKESEIEAALGRGQHFETRIEQLEQELKDNALNRSLMQFKASDHSDLEPDVLGKLVEIATRDIREDKKGKLT